MTGKVRDLSSEVVGTLAGLQVACEVIAGTLPLLKTLRATPIKDRLELKHST